MRTVVFSVILAMALPVFAASEDSAEGGLPSASKISYSSVEEALSDLKAKPQAKLEVREADQWLIVSETEQVQWSFVPKTHEAYPAVIRREVKGNANKGGQTIQMAVLCQSEVEAACERLVDGLFKADNGGQGSFQMRRRSRVQ